MRRDCRPLTIRVTLTTVVHMKHGQHMLRSQPDPTAETCCRDIAISDMQQLTQLQVAT